MSETPWTAQVEVVKSTEIGQPPQQGRSVRAATEEQRVRLARQLQSELKRVGCYDGSVDGDWRASSKDAMAAFIRSVDASLPYSEPDHILFNLVKSHRGQACGASPLVTASSRPKSLTAAILGGGMAAAAVPVGQRQPAKAEAETERAEIGRTTAVRIEANALRPVPLPGRMSIGGPLAPPLAGEPALVAPPAVAVRPTRNTSLAMIATGTANEAASDFGAPSPVTAAEANEAALAAPHVSSRGGRAVGPHPSVRSASKPSATSYRRAAAYVPARADKSSRQRRLVYDMFLNPNRN